MAQQLEPIAKMVAQLSRLPGIGQKSAQRLAYHIISMPLEDVKELAPAILAHRLTYRGIYGQGEAANVFEKLLDEVAVPTEERGK